MGKEEFAVRENLRYDTRLIDRYLREGKVGRKDFESYIKSLPDDGVRSEEIEIHIEGEDALTFTSG